MGIVREVPWDQGRDEFFLWKNRILGALATELQARYSAPGQSVCLKGDEIRIRRGSTWGFDVSISLTEGAEAAGKDKEKTKSEAQDNEKKGGIVRIETDYGCRVLDRSAVFIIVAGVSAAIPVTFYYFRELYRSGILKLADNLCKGGWLTPLIIGVGVGFIVRWIIARFARLLGDPPRREEHERLIDEVGSLTEAEVLSLKDKREPA